jgi:hypothetical protein
LLAVDFHCKEITPFRVLRKARSFTPENRHARRLRG